MIEYQENYSGNLQGLVDGCFCFELYKYQMGWLFSFVMECDEEVINADELRQIADKLDELNGVDQ